MREDTDDVIDSQVNAGADAALDQVTPVHASLTSQSSQDTAGAHCQAQRGGYTGIYGETER